MLILFFVCFLFLLFFVRLWQFDSCGCCLLFVVAVAVISCSLVNRYVAPRRAAAMYDDEEEEVKKQKIQDRLKRKIEKSQLLKELRSEFSDKPEERKDYNTISNNDVDLETENKERQEYEEEYMTRLVMSKKGKHWLCI